MQDNKKFIEIKLVRVIPGKKRKVIRLLTKVWEFPAYIPFVKEVTVLQQKHNCMLTKWRIQTDGVPINWLEEDILDLKNDTIHFQSKEGDLAQFKGKWQFKEHKEGTEVTLVVLLEVGIPVIKDFADSYIKKLLQKNFEAILDAMERRLISIKYADFRRGSSERIAGFGIITHFYNFYHLEQCIKNLNPEFKMPSFEFLSQLFHITPSFKLQDIISFKSKNAKFTNGCLVVSTFIPDMLEKDCWAVFSKVVKACKIAEKHDVGIVSLSGFNSIVEEKIGHKVSDEVDVAVTSGNTFTAAMAIDGVIKAAKLLQLDLAQAKGVIIGGAGDIGSACARFFAEELRQLTITDLDKEGLRRVRTELMKKRKSRITATNNNETAIREADIIITAASASASILNVNWFKPGAIVCDIGYPKNIAYVPIQRDDILVFSGGLAKSPSPLVLNIDVGLPNKDTIYGCFAEGIILALEHRYENFSSGKGNITIEKINEIRKLGKRNGFEAADFYWGNSPINQIIIERVKEAIKGEKAYKYA
ncbi:MAG: SRPBCC family protein [Candidatus Omnitrophota bacterium]